MNKMIIESNNGFKVRRLEKKDDSKIEKVIRDCLIEFGLDHEGTIWVDPRLGELSGEYDSDGCCYWVAETSDGQIIAGAGIGKVAGQSDVCELQKMYCRKDFRGKGVAQALMSQALEYAAGRYKRCYIETFGNTLAAQRFYSKCGFERTEERLGDTGHFACDVRFIKELP